MKCYIAVVSLCGLLLAGCVSTTSQSLKDANYSQKIQSVALIENRGLADKYPMLNDRTGLIIKELNAKFTQSKIPFETATVKSQDNLALNANSQALSSIKPSVKHFL